MLPLNVGVFSYNTQVHSLIYGEFIYLFALFNDNKWERMLKEAVVA
jgi:hypothetical protein